MKNNESILVAIQCFVYNHEPFLRECLDGFIMQKTNFRFVAIIHDDCSIDNSAIIIREYAQKFPDIIFPIFEEENHFSKHDGSLTQIVQEAIFATGAKYIAWCEGDDYWIDPYKLQKQVDFLESHSDYVACFHNARVYNGQFCRLFNSVNENNFPSTEDIILRRWFIASPSLLYRNMLKAYPDWTNSVVNGDYLLELLLAREGKFYYMHDVMAVYRQQGQGLSEELNAHKIDLYEKLIFLLGSMQKLYPKQYADVFSQSISNYQRMKANYQKELYFEHHPILKVFRPKTYKRAIKRWLKKYV